MCKIIVCPKIFVTNVELKEWISNKKKTALTQRIETISLPVRKKTAQQHNNHSQHIYYTSRKKSSQSNIKKFCYFFLDISLLLLLAFIKFNLIVAIIGSVYRIQLHLICFGWARFLVIPFAFDCIKTWTHRHKV